MKAIPQKPKHPPSIQEYHIKGAKLIGKKEKKKNVSIITPMMPPAIGGTPALRGSSHALRLPLVQAAFVLSMKIPLGLHVRVKFLFGAKFHSGCYCRWWWSLYYNTQSSGGGGGGGSPPGAKLHSCCCCYCRWWILYNTQGSSSTSRPPGGVPVY